ncbi:shisa family member 2a [Astyanax mexicanus]|uniref:shisa family member 2a n=1 Tax=Astyanax mexicanus TaxID=7994 RepID=UPI0020CB1F4D|nr:shisa family member 2a [Astyanax mexicanus]
MAQISRSVCALLALLCVFSPPVRAAAGQYCHGWGSFPGFRCPERHDGGDARYCCGTCTVRYCCSSPSARLDQSTCDAEQPAGGNGGVRTLQQAVPTYLPFVIVVGAFLSFVLLGIIISICCCHCVKPKPTAGSAPAHTSLLEPVIGPSPNNSTPSRSSTSGSAGPHPFTAPMPQPFVSAPPPPLHQGAPQFFQPFLNYSLPPEHTMLMAPAFLDSRSAFSQAHGQPFPQAPMHTEPIYPTVTV